MCSVFFLVCHSANTFEVGTMLRGTTSLPLSSTIITSCLCLACGSKYDGYVPWADDSLSWEYSGCGWAVVIGRPPGQELEDDPSVWFLLHLDLDDEDRFNSKDFDASFSVGAEAYVLYVENGGVVVQDAIYGGGVCGWEFESVDPTADDGNWWLATSGSIDASVTYTGEIQSNECGDFPLYEADILLSDLSFQNMYTDAVATTPLSSLVIPDVTIGWNYCEG